MKKSTGSSCGMISSLPAQYLIVLNKILAEPLPHRRCVISALRSDLNNQTRNQAVTLCTFKFPNK